MPRQPLVLCIDDYAPGLITRNAAFESKGFRVLTAEEVDRALELVEREPVDVVVLDYKMPGNGGTVARILRSAHHQIRILLLCGFPRRIPESVLRMADGVIEKGEPIPILINEIERLTGAKAKNR